MYNVSIRSKYFECITFNTFINLLILLKNCINYVQCKNIETQWKNIHLRIKILRFLEVLNCIYTITLKMLSTETYSHSCH